MRSGRQGAQCSSLVAFSSIPMPGCTCSTAAEGPRARPSDECPWNRHERASQTYGDASRGGPRRSSATESRPHQPLKLGRVGVSRYSIHHNQRMILYTPTSTTIPRRASAMAYVAANASGTAADHVGHQLQFDRRARASSCTKECEEGRRKARDLLCAHWAAVERVERALIDSISSVVRSSPASYSAPTPSSNTLHGRPVVTTGEARSTAKVARAETTPLATTMRVR
jgi:hypothetical protein